MRNFIERIKSYLTRKDCADMAICTWKSANEEVYADFCKRMDAIDKGDLSILIREFGIRKRLKKLWE